MNLLQATSLLIIPAVASAPCLPDAKWKPLILTSAYILVIVSIIAPGRTVVQLANRLGREPTPA